MHLACEDYLFRAVSTAASDYFFRILIESFEVLIM